MIITSLRKMKFCRWIPACYNNALLPDDRLAELIQRATPRVQLTQTRSGPTASKLEELRSQVREWVRANS